MNSKGVRVKLFKVKHTKACAPREARNHTPSLLKNFLLNTFGLIVFFKDMFLLTSFIALNPLLRSYFNRAHLQKSTWKKLRINTQI